MAFRTRTRNPNIPGIAGGLLALSSLVLPWLLLKARSEDVNNASTSDVGLNLFFLANIVRQFSVSTGSEATGEVLLFYILIGIIMVGFMIALAKHPLGGALPLGVALFFFLFTTRGMARASGDLAGIDIRLGWGFYTALSGGTLSLLRLALRVPGLPPPPQD